MKTYLLAALLLLGCTTPTGTEFHRGTVTVRPPPRPTYTPAGAGAPVVGQPGYQRPTLPPSPNRRVLPPTEGPGLWSADEPKAVKEDRAAQLQVFAAGVKLPSPEGESTAAVRVCGMHVNEAVKRGGAKATFAAAPRKERECAVARLFASCLAIQGQKDQKKLRAGDESKRSAVEQFYAALQVALQFRKTVCEGVTLSDEMVEAYDTSHPQLDSIINPRKWKKVTIDDD